ncbi:winged helix-turn-helix domain-containing protein [Proteiniborus sp. MB09-C3]|uniref:helix-turn-helix domain-containing protein n=1 Tax=Proteiniborus sp. MB09-C3 TaxID=3050072 RepID=UPI0025566ED8|nr:winged helix-turn-helix domain-containing protein [Proteiniborus sp. MB09-C3]WIV13662.1 winged helix-turn-helix domain-containing protein [Proteiniborus sp. MB09-C3]
MGRKLLEITTLHGFTIDELIAFEESYQKKSLKALLRTVIMRYNGIHTEEIQHILGKSRPAITGYINKWNKYGLEALVDNRGGSVSTFTDEMLEDLKDTVLNKSPKDFGFLSSTWDTHMLSKYIVDTFGKECSSEWIRQMLIKLGFSYKRGQYMPTKGDPELQEAFKKSCWFTRHN